MHSGLVDRLDLVSRLVGHTPYLRLSQSDLPRSSFYIKLEGHNPTGSIKDRAALRMVSTAVAALGRTERPHLLDASSGNMACSIAFFASIVGVPATLVVSSKLTAEKRAFIEYFRASLVTVGDHTIDGNRYCRSLVGGVRSGEYVFLDQLHNWENPAAHYATTGPEIYQAFPNCRMLVGSLGSGGSLLGTARYLKERIPQLTVVATEAAVGSRMPGVGAFEDGDYRTPFILAGMNERCFDVRIQVSLADATRTILDARSDGVFGGLQTGAVLHGARTVARDRAIEGNIVVISGDSGWKNVETLSAICRAAEPLHQ